MADSNEDQGLGYIKPQTGPRAGQKIYLQRTGGVAKHITEVGPETPMETADRESGDNTPPSTNENASESGMESSTSGRYSDHGGVPNRTNQSTDHMNSY